MGPVAFDTETEPIRPGVQAPRMVCLSIADEQGEILVHHSEARSWFEALVEGDRLLVGHNVAFDMVVAAYKWPDLLPAIFAKYERDQVTDTLLRQKLIDIASFRRVRTRYALANLAKRWFNIEMDKDTWRLHYDELYDVPVESWPDGARGYALDDARITLAIWGEQTTKNKYLADEFRQTRAAWWFQLMRVWGICTDSTAVEALATRLQKKHDEIHVRLVEAGLVRGSGVRNTKAAAERMAQLCSEKGVRLALTPTGRPKLDRDTCGRTGDGLLQDYAEFSGLKKKIGTDVKLLRLGLVQANFNTLLETGRSSSSPNVQNLPRKGGVRECFVPRHGKVFASADYSQFELRAVSQVVITLLGIPSKLAEALNAGFDPHLEVARRIVNITYDEASAALAFGGEDVDRARQVGKVANFGFPGGLGIDTFVEYARKSYGVVISRDEAGALKRYWTEAWPEFSYYFDWIGRQCESGLGSIKQVFVERYRGGCRFTEACNTLFQGLAADAAKHAGFLVAKACYVDESSPLFGGRIVNFVHDEFIVEVDDDETASDAADELARIMVKGAGMFLPDVPPVAEPCLMRCWSKKAKPKRNGDGRLIPWEP